MKTTVGKELRSLNNSIRRQVDASPIKREIDNVTGTNGWIIGYLSEHLDTDVFQKDIEREFGITRSTASKVLTLMEKKELIRRECVAHDARLKKLVLTEKSLELVEMMRDDARVTENKLMRGFTDDEIETLAGFIARMKNNMVND